MNPSPPRRRLLGEALLTYRVARGLVLEDMADLLDCHPSKLSRIETGQRGISALDLQDLLSIYDVPDRDQAALAALATPVRSPAWAREAAAILPLADIDYLQLETTARQIRYYGAVQVPDLLQTAQYAAALAAAQPEASERDRDTLLPTLLARQQALRSRRTVQVTIIVGEAALHQQVGTPDVMRQQIIRLADACDESARWAVRVLPFTSGARAAAMTQAATACHLRLAAPRLSIVQTGALPGATYLTSPGQVSDYAARLIRLEEAALTPALSGSFLRQLAASRERP